MPTENPERDTYHLFLSHTYEERHLADAFKTLVERVSYRDITAWYSSDPRPTGGTELGDWREQIEHELARAQLAVALITPDSNGRTWIAYEAGFTHGKEKETIPLYFFMKRDAIQLFDQNTSMYSGSTEGDGEPGVEKLLVELLKKAGKQPTEDTEKAWAGLLKDYREKVGDEEEKLRGRQMFQDHFHDAKLAEHMENKIWYAAWTQIEGEGADKKETEWLSDQLKCWSTDNRLRFVGEDVTKRTMYPMEGVRSRRGLIALSYWSDGEIPICGTVLMRATLRGDQYNGWWRGHTAKSLEAGQLEIVHGRVMLTLDEEERNRWRDENVSHLRDGTPVG